MKTFILLLIVVGSIFAQNTTYIDGSECSECDSIITKSDGLFTYQSPMLDGNKHGVEKRMSHFFGGVTNHSELFWVHGYLQYLINYRTNGMLWTVITYDGTLADTTPATIDPMETRITATHYRKDGSLFILAPYR